MVQNDQSLPFYLQKYLSADSFRCTEFIKFKTHNIFIAISRVFKKYFRWFFPGKNNFSYCLALL